MFIHMSTGKLKPVFAFQKERSEQSEVLLNQVKNYMCLDLQMECLEELFHPVPHQFVLYNINVDSYTRVNNEIFYKATTWQKPYIVRNKNQKPHQIKLHFKN